MPKCGSQIILCNLPIRFDTYTGCSHACRYCFVQRGRNIEAVKKAETTKSLMSFIAGNRTRETNWCDWDIPLHWGGVSDPFQPAESRYRNSLECLKVFAETQYPFVVSTKGRMVIEPEYIKLLEASNCAVQISMVCDKYDVMEQGAPPYQERLEMAEKLSGRVKRVIARIQPYMREIKGEVMKNLPRLRDAGVYGIVVEGMKFAKRKPGLEKVAGDYGYPIEALRKDFTELREEAHQLGLKFYSGENRLRGMGDSLTCCGVDGLEGFQPNEYNLCSLMNGTKSKPTPRMLQPDTAACFSSLNQTSLGHQMQKGKSFHEYLMEYYESRERYIQEIFGRSRIG